MGEQGGEQLQGGEARVERGVCEQAEDGLDCAGICEEHVGVSQANLAARTRLGVAEDEQRLEQRFAEVCVHARVGQGSEQCGHGHRAHVDGHVACEAFQREYRRPTVRYRRRLRESVRKLGDCVLCSLRRPCRPTYRGIRLREEIHPSLCEHATRGRRRGTDLCSGLCAPLWTWSFHQYCRSKTTSPIKRRTRNSVTPNCQG